MTQWTSVYRELMTKHAINRIRAVCLPMTDFRAMPNSVMDEFPISELEIPAESVEGAP
jgi:hypothetical protein